MPTEKLSTLQKALAINLDETKYGTIAEIGAGQEVARFFFQAGGAAGTIAKTMSAYDMQFSNAIYGVEASKRYVCQSRVRKMLDHEYELLIERLKDIRSKKTTFFAFADTVAAKSYNSASECHGWMGIRVQLYPGAEPSEVSLHVRMLDGRNQEQAAALGILGVNLIYGAYYLYREPKKLIESLLDNVERSRLEIDMIEMRGPYFDDIDNRLMALHLVQSGITNAVIYAPSGEVLQPSEIFYKKNVLIFRGSFRPVTVVNMDMAKQGRAKFFSEDDCTPENTIVLAELTMPKLKEGAGAAGIDQNDFLARVDILCALGFTVMISEYTLYSALRAYINRYTKRKIGIGLGAPNILEIFNENWYSDVEGGMLEILGKIFTGSTRLYVYPYIDETGTLVGPENLRVPEHLKFLYRHLYENHYIVPLECSDEGLLKWKSREILAELRRGDGKWKEGVPEQVYESIVSRRLFGFNSE